MELKTSYFSKDILKAMRKKDPVLYKNLRIQDINKITARLMKNLNMCIYKKQDVYLTNFMSIHMNKKERVKKIRSNLPEI